MSATLLSCPKCGSNHIVKNGKIHNGKQNFKCRDCSRQFVQNPQKKMIDSATKDLIDKLLLEKLPWAGIARVTGVSEPWLQKYVNAKLEDVPIIVAVSAKKRTFDNSMFKPRRGGRGFEMWSFVGHKGNKQWIWLALDISTKEIVGAYIGERSIDGARGLWNSLPGVYRQCAFVSTMRSIIAYTDFWSAYEEIFPKKRHKAVSKTSGLTNYIERLNCTLRQRISRLVRKTLSFSKKLENHIGVIWYFIHHYNASLLV